MGLNKPKWWEKNLMMLLKQKLCRKYFNEHYDSVQREKQKTEWNMEQSKKQAEIKNGLSIEQLWIWISSLWIISGWYWARFLVSLSCGFIYKIGANMPVTQLWHFNNEELNCLDLNPSKPEEF